LPLDVDVGVDGGGAAASTAGDGSKLVALGEALQQEDTCPNSHNLYISDIYYK
jgi:hypothetical protein